MYQNWSTRPAVQKAWQTIGKNLNHLKAEVEVRSYFQPHNVFRAIMEENDRRSKMGVSDRRDIQSSDDFDRPPTHRWFR